MADDANGDEMPPPASPSPAAGPPDGVRVMAIRFRDMNGTNVQFKLKSTTRLGKAMNAFGERVSRDRKTLRFIFEGERVLDTSTAEQLEMEEGSIVDVYEEQIGGTVAAA